MCNDVYMYMYIVIDIDIRIFIHTDNYIDMLFSFTGVDTDAVSTLVTRHRSKSVTSTQGVSNTFFPSPGRPSSLATAKRDAAFHTLPMNHWWYVVQSFWLSTWW